MISVVRRKLMTSELSFFDEGADYAQRGQAKIFEGSGFGGRV